MERKKVAYILLADGFEEVEALAPYDIMHRGGVDVTLVSATATLGVRSSHGVEVVARRALPDGLGDYDLLMLPGGMPGMTNLRDSRLVADEVRRASTGGKLIGAICASPSVLGGLGLLEGRRATCYPGFEQNLTGATTTGESVVEDGNIVTGIGAGASMEFGLKLLERLTDKATADAVREQIILR